MKGKQTKAQEFNAKVKQQQGVDRAVIFRNHSLVSDRNTPKKDSFISFNGKSIY